MSRHVRLEPEAAAEYRNAGRWYETHRQHLGVEFFDAVEELNEIRGTLGWLKAACDL